MPQPPAPHTLQDMLKDHPEINLTDSTVEFNSEERLPLLRLTTNKFSALLALQGAQLIEFRDSKGTDLLWTSPNAIFQRGTAIRGGIPICFPWFGRHPTDADKPNHGFARTRDWQLDTVESDSSGDIALTLKLTSDNHSLSLFPHRFEASLRFEFNETLSIIFTVCNASDEPMPCSWALHSYFPVSNLAQTRVSGLDQHSYLDNTQSLLKTIQTGDISFDGEVDRVYLSVGEQQIIHGLPCIAINGKNCPTAIIWNPGAELTKRAADLGPDMHKHYICVERGAAFSNSWNIAPGKTMTATMHISALRTE